MMHDSLHDDSLFRIFCTWDKCYITLHDMWYDWVVGIQNTPIECKWYDQPDSKNSNWLTNKTVQIPIANGQALTQLYLQLKPYKFTSLLFQIHRFSGQVAPQRRLHHLLPPAEPVVGVAREDRQMEIGGWELCKLAHLWYSQRPALSKLPHYQDILVSCIL